MKYHRRSPDISADTDVESTSPINLGADLESAKSAELFNQLVVLSTEIAQISEDAQRANKLEQTTAGQLTTISGEMANTQQQRNLTEEYIKKWGSLRRQAENGISTTSEGSSTTLAEQVISEESTASAHYQRCQSHRRHAQEQREQIILMAQQWAALRQRSIMALVDSEPDEQISSEIEISTHDLQRYERGVASVQTDRQNAERARAHAYARMNKWRAVGVNSESIIRDTSELDAADKIIDQATRQLIAIQATLNQALVPRKAAIAQFHEQARIIEQYSTAITGIETDGFGSYLIRSSADQRSLIFDINRIAQEDGAKRAGRPRSSNNVKKAQRAAKARERRAIEAALKREGAQDTTNTDNSRRGKHRKQRRSTWRVKEAPAGPLSENIAFAGSQPALRQNEERLARLAPDEQIIYADHLERSRIRGKHAAIQDADLRRLIPMSVYSPPHAAIPLGEGASMIAIRGADPEQLASAFKNGLTTLETWLSEPAKAWRQKVGSRTRLRYHAGHLVAAWSPALAQKAVDGSLDSALSHEVDRVIARLDLTGHRVAAILHTDSESGHPHLHIQFSRIRESDTSLWSMEGRERTPGLWLHARSNTALAGGETALEDDVDALAGWGPAAIAGELMMADQNLAITRRSIYGMEVRVPIQGPLAAKRLAAVGSMEGSLAGGVWKFGLGRDKKEVDAWLHDLKAAQESNDQKRIDEILRNKPKNRGYWLRPTEEPPPGTAWVFKRGFGWYLMRI